MCRVSIWIYRLRLAPQFTIGPHFHDTIEEFPHTISVRITYWSCGSGVLKICPPSEKSKNPGICAGKNLLNKRCIDANIPLHESDGLDFKNLV